MKIDEEDEDEACRTYGETRFEHKIYIGYAGEIHETSADLRDSSASSADHQPLLEDRVTVDEVAFSPSRQASFSSNIVADTFVCTRSIFILARYLGIGYRWMTNLAALFLYGFFIMPGVLQVGWRYFSDKRIHRGIPYGQDPRNKLDLYLPDNLETPRPVVAFVSGGAWIIGYKAWGSLLALQLVEEGVIVACMDYRNFPQGTISDMVEDVSQGISFICNNIANYGGDLDRLYLVGQSAGAHLGACTLLNQAKKECEGSIVDTSSQEHGNGMALLPWRASQFKAYIGISGGYDLNKLADHFHHKGMNRSLFFRVASLRDAWESRWNWFHRPIHALSHILHPLWRSDDQALCEELETGWSEYMTRWVGGDIQMMRILEQERLYFRNATGKYFGSPTARLRECQIEPVSWWEKYGIGAPNLRKIALRVLSQDCSSGPCERNWSTWALFHTKKRNKLSTAQLERLVYCHCNLRLLEQRGNPIEPQQVNPDLIDIEKVKDIPQIPSEERDIYSMLYEEAMQPLHTTRSRTGSRRIARVASSEIAEASTSASASAGARATHTIAGGETTVVDIDAIDTLDDSSDSEWTTQSEASEDEDMDDLDSAEEA